MGLLDVLNGMQNAPGGQRTPGTGGGGGGLSPMTMALLGTLPYKVIKSLMDNRATAASTKPGAPFGTTDTQSPGTASGGLDDLLKGGLGGLLAGGAAGSVLSGGLNDLLKQFQNGQGEVARSWIGSGANEAITPKDLASALGADRIIHWHRFPGCLAMICSMDLASSCPM